MQPQGLNPRPLELINISNKPTQLKSCFLEENIHTLTSDHTICTSTIISAIYHHHHHHHVMMMRMDKG